MGAADRPKQYLDLKGRTVLEWAIAPFLRLSTCERIAVVLAAGDDRWRDLPVMKDARILTAKGGSERAQSVCAGLSALREFASDDDWVLVHDAARPCLGDSDLKALITQVGDDAVGGLLAVRVVDTLKRADEHGRVAETLPREGLWRALTPQMFRFGILQRALAASAERRFAVTDECQAVEMLGLRPRLITGSVNNLKITTPEDLEQAARILSGRGHA
jgi:2-C-methyl-D-erythritol 4-phosphate cytidylyltransferase